jgi:hypothetical protein
MGARSKNRVIVPARQAKKAGGIDSLKSISGLLKGLKIRALSPYVNVYGAQESILRNRFLQ